MVLREQGPAEDSRLILEDIPIPSHGEREILLRVRECGVCRTDLHIVEGELIPPSLPIVPGHQVVGEVVDSGESCGRFSRGDMPLLLAGP